MWITIWTIDQFMVSHDEYGIIIFKIQKKMNM